MAKVESLDGPIGWLVDPHNKWAIHFDLKNESNRKNSNDFTIDMWGLAPDGRPMKFKSRRKSTKQDSVKTWNQLIASNWDEVDLKRINIA